MPSHPCSAAVAIPPIQRWCPTESFEIGRLACRPWNFKHQIITPMLRFDQTEQLRAKPAAFGRLLKRLLQQSLRLFGQTTAMRPRALLKLALHMRCDLANKQIRHDTLHLISMISNAKKKRNSVNFLGPTPPRAWPPWRISSPRARA